ncbi:glycosyltransferase family 2 protein [Microbacterium murale]|uniref:Glycosyl transferase family 2 n=1 Tax=Microbacterium murale TaxID=1081040 RepID=A0ABQ1RQE7_9MICO|nr:glycosyltransferase family 2 protein [Microbacterium murale]GGD75618.1 glycosyl transferase family 2 [Microbacterium murale]
MSLPRIALCVVTYHSAPLIEDLVASIPQGAEGTEWTLVFADNASTDHTISEINRCAPDAILVETGANLGYSAGVNAAVAAAGEQDAYLILNADVRLTPGCVATLYDTLGGGVGIAVPRLIDGHGALIWSLRREQTLLRAWCDALIGAERAGRIGTLGEVVTDTALYDSPQIAEWAEGSTQLVSAECWTACGTWDESYFLYSEETEYDLRVRKHGFVVRYEPAAVAQHLKGGSAESPRQWSLLVMNKAMLYARRHGPFASVSLWLALVVREASRAALGKHTSRAALGDLLRPRRWRERRGPQWLAGVRL